MRSSLISFFTAFCCYIASAQEVPVQRNIRLEFIKGDSTRLSFNEEFYIIEDSCAQIYRYAHIDVQNKVYTGQFKDVSRANANQIITQGAYTADGLKNGPFIINYLNGVLQAKGNFKDGAFDGRWDVYYDTGKPKITFEANGNDIKIINEWDAKGTQTVINGTGNYRADMGFMYWKGKLLNGKPEGKWKSKKASDDSDFTSEVYKNGDFQKGNTSYDEYRDAPRLVLISPSIFPFTIAEKFQISAVACNGPKQKAFVNAHYTAGAESFSQHIADLSSDYLKNIDINTFDSQLTLEGEISEIGVIGKLQNRNPFNANVARGLITSLRGLPNLQPATVDGKPVKQGFKITYTFHNGIYSFRYGFAPIQQ
ncbi:hypothetical protein EWM62_11440 [Mucilaginibacter terrigena]|uniref:MORN repeat variant n=1 Tax=Mucilaginibacter terrigena TaxID=2492395 RepID=A0A4Q5LKQ8_9SPHI|nr:hypothetical protein [Mucilaginibacter terrigena]RYU90147.1 hypothetical protein EWM62_11440 [Mucilaginibacter terrigena]